MIVTLNEDSRIEWAGPAAWMLARRSGGNFALAGIPGAARRPKTFEPVGKFGSLPEAFVVALRLGLAMPGEPLDLSPMNRALRGLDADLPMPAPMTPGHGYWLEPKGETVLVWYRGEKSIKPRLVRICPGIRQGIEAAAWDYAGRAKVTVAVGEVGELLAGIVAGLVSQAAGEGVLPTGQPAGRS